MIGQVLSHYRIVDKLGEGGMGEVWLAEDDRLNRKVALKFLSGPMASDPIAHQRFVREARAAAALDHPFVCKIYDAGEIDGRAFIAMEYAEGLPLSDRLKEGPLPIDETLRLAGEIAEAMDAAHQRHIVHRDLKPGNIMLTGDGHLKILDFGLAKQLPFGESVESCDVPTALTGSGVIQGTIGYMSPEQLRQQTVDTRSDVFAFGIVLYEMLTGTAPFERDNAADTVNAILCDDPPPMERFRKGVPRAFEQIVRKMLSKSVDQRHASVRELRADLDVLRSMDQTGVGVVPPLGDRRVPRWALVAGVAVLLAALVGTWMFAPRRARPNGGFVATRTPAPPELPRLAVLPFKNIGGLDDNAPKSEGLTHTLITRLARLEGLQVISRSSVLTMQDTKLTTAEIAERLDADYVVGGSVEILGERCRISVELIRAEDDSNLWAELFTMPWSDIFAVQDQVSQSVIDNLDVVLQPRARSEVVAGDRPVSVEAYELFTRGLYHARRFEEGHDLDEFEKAQRFLQRAIDADPSYLEPLTLLGILYEERFEMERKVGKGEEWRERSERLLLQVLERDPRQAKAVSRLSWIAERKGDPARFQELALQAIEIDPGLSEPYNALASFYYFQGFYESAVEEYEAAIRLEPLRVPFLRNAAFPLLKLGRYDEALRYAREVRELKPDHWDIDGVLASVQIYRGELDAAERILEASLAKPKISESLFDELTILKGLVAGLRGDIVTASRVYEDYLDTPAGKANADAMIPLAATLDRSDDAVRLIRVLRAGKPPNYRELLDPMLESLRCSDEGFQSLLEQQYRAWEQSVARYGDDLPVAPPAPPSPRELCDHSSI